MTAIRLVTLGAEVSEAASLTSWLVGRGVTVSIGHSAPTRERYDEVVSAGARMVTHLYNAMSGVHHRDDSLALWALNDPRVVCGLITDRVHVSDAAIDLAFRSTRGGIALVTDSVSVRVPGWGSSAIGSDGVPRLADGTLAGSRLTMPRALRNSMTVTGLGVAPVVDSATRVPAGVIGLADRGAIAIGQRADLVELSDDLSVLKVWVEGRRRR